ncbi:XPA (predicted) [Pycnogonum litorale]
MESEQLSNSKKINECDEKKTTGKKLTDSELARIERNRQKALLLKQARLSFHPYRTCSNSAKTSMDTGGGFLLEHNDDDTDKITDNIVERPMPSVLNAADDRLHCLECSNEFIESHLHTNFNEPVCDGCRDNEDKHKLISKTEAKTQYLLKDCDLDLREPHLKYVLRKNPHHQHGDMKLYLQCQIYKRAIEVWNSEDALEAEHERRNEEREKRKHKKYQKKLKTLRMNVRSSLYKRDLEGHQHEYGPESYDSDDDMYSKVCKTCNHQLTYEKM